MIDASTVLDGLTDGVVVVDTARRCAYLNPSACGLLAVAHGESVGRPVDELLGDAVLAEAVERVLATGLPETHDSERPNGRMHRYRFTAHPLGLVIVFRELVGPPRHSTRRDSSALLQQVVDVAPVGITVTGLDGRLRLANGVTRTWSGPAAQASIGHLLDEYVSPGLATTVAAAEARVRETLVPEVVSSWSYPDGEEPALLEISVFPVFEDDRLTGTGAIYTDVTRHERAEHALRDLMEERRRLVERVVDAEERERTRIAEDIHDDSLQALAAVGVRLAALSRVVQGEAAESVSAVRDTLGAAMTRLRALLFDLEPTGADASLLAALRAAAEFILDPAGIDWRVPDHGADLPYAERVIAVRIALEAFANARSHSQATYVTVAVRAHDRGVEVSITDDGVGVDPTEVRSEPGHRGITTMFDRVALAGGWLRFEPATPRGTAVRYWLPAPD